MKNKFDKYFLPKKEKKWYHFKTLKTDILILYPLMVIVYYCQIVAEKIKNRDNYSDKRTEKILTKHIKYYGDFSIENGKKQIKLIVDRFYRIDIKGIEDVIHKNYCSKYKTEMYKYLEFDYEIEGYKKIISYDKYDSEVAYITFEEI